MPDFEFVDYSGPGDPGKPRRRTVRAHAARNGTARRERVAQYQREKQQRDDAERERLRRRDLAAGIIAVDRVEWTTPSAANMGTEVEYWQMYSGPVDILGAARSDPFGSFVRRLSPMDCFLLDYFANSMVLSAIERYTSCTPQEQIAWATRVSHAWVQMGAADAGILGAILAAACRHHDMITGAGTYRELSIVHQAQVVVSLRESLASEEGRPSDATIVKTICLATEAATHDETDVAKRHLAAALRMYELRDGQADTSSTSPPTTATRPNSKSNSNSPSPPVVMTAAPYEPDHGLFDDRFEEQKRLISLFKSRSAVLRRRMVKWKEPKLDEGCYVYMNFMVSRCHVTV